MIAVDNNKIMINWKTSLPIRKIINTSNKSRYCSRWKKYHYVRIDMSKLDHFIEFIEHPYFYQDVSYGTNFWSWTVVKLYMEMPNVMRTVTHSTMINQYVQLCQVEKCEPLSRSMLFKILDVRVRCTGSLSEKVTPRSRQYRCWWISSFPHGWNDHW